MGAIYDRHKQCSLCTKSFCTSLCHANYFWQSFVNNVSQWPNDSTHKQAETHTHNPQTKPLMQSEQFEQTRLRIYISSISGRSVLWLGIETLVARLVCLQRTEHRTASYFLIGPNLWVILRECLFLVRTILSHSQQISPLSAKGKLIPRYYYSCSNEPIN